MSGPAPIEAEINAAARIIGDISTGIYRSPANALKELISNSFDAGATEVLINTDHPSFSTISCFDNGPGISAQQLQDILSYIGGSNKRLDQAEGPYGRPIVGKIGIGILAMSQIAKQFVIISSREGEPHRIEAEVDIEEFESERAVRSNLGTGTIGHYKIYEIPEESSEHYTIVATPAGSAMLRTHLGKGASVRERFVSRRYEARDFKDFVRQVSEQKRRTTLSKYDMFLWELAMLCPVPYFDDGPVKDWRGWDHIKRRLLSYNFRIVVDGYELRKPILLPTIAELSKPDEDYKVYPVHLDESEADGLQLHGYVFHQRKQISPPELQGVLLRIRNVGIKGYESDLLDYPRNLGPMRGGLSGEIYVDIGLEDALNIDRNSFNETDEHFLRVRDTLFEHLGLPDRPGLTNDIRERSSRRQVAVRRDRTVDDLERLTRRMSRSFSGAWQLELDEMMDTPLRLDLKNNAVRVNIGHDTVPTTRSGRQEFFRVCLIARLVEAQEFVVDSKDPIVEWLRKI